MKEFTVNIYPVKTGMFFTSYVHPLTKKRVRKSFESKTEAQEHKYIIEERFRKTKFKNLMELNVGELLNLFILEVPNNPLSKYSKLHFADFAETFGDFKVEKMSSDALKVWLDQIQKENNLKDMSVRKVKCDFDSFFKYLVVKDIIAESPLTEIYYERITPPVHSRNILSESEIKRILEAVKEFSPGYLYPLIRIFAETGAKSTEVVELDWRDVDLENGKVKFKRTSSSCERVLSISHELIQILNKKRSKQGHVFVTYYGEPFTKNKLGRAVTEFKVKSKYPRDWCASDFRHSFAVNFLAKGRSMNDLQYILGHSNVYQTKQLYGGITKETIQKNFKNPFDPDSARPLSN